MSAARRSSPQTSPSDLELQILSVLWRSGPSTAREVLEALPDGKSRAYTTVLSIMQVMQKKGLLDVSDHRGLAHVYRPLGSRRQVLGPVMRGMLKKLFGGSPSAAVEHLLDVAAVSQEELDAIVRLVNQAAAQRKGKRGQQ